MATVSSRMVLRVVALAAGAGLPGRALAEHCGIRGATLDDPDGRVDREASYDLIERVAGLLDEPAPGVRLAFTHDPSTYDAAGLVLLSASTLRQGFVRAFRLQVLWGDGERFAIERDTLRFDPGPGSRPAHDIVAECALFEILAAAQLFAGGEVRPLRAALRGARPAHAGALAPLGEIQWGAPRNELTLPASALDAPAPPGLAAALAPIERGPSVSFAGTIAASISRALIRGDASLVAVAAAFGVSPRTLQRRLSDEGAVFERIVDSEREALARSLLRKGLAIDEIGPLLGYNDRAAFYRAFRRWTGATPDAVRRELRAAAP